MGNIGLVLSGGGARAAYQVGAVRALSEIWGSGPAPFNIYAGLSAGAINCTSLASNSDNFAEAARILTETWMALHPNAVYRTEARTLASLGLRWMKDLTVGGLVGVSQVNYLLDTSPLRELLGKRIDFARIPTLIEAGTVRGVAVSATNYMSGTIVTTFDGAPAIKPWLRTGRIAVRGQVRLDHVMASAAIPLFFPPVVVDGNAYADGGVRMTTPTSPAIHLGADKIADPDAESRSGFAPRHRGANRRRAAKRALSRLPRRRPRTPRARKPYTRPHSCGDTPHAPRPAA